ncbi:flavin reductase [Micromonospora sp. WMMD1120]|uniref:flavin reductase n=1 Tax=Micromonospora sp. WMMD1120 TaxID=3016106 RepID=UPI00241696A0|nr:flavin reductase [Micromonospora sp. WMMD1120]MDG4806718.1 flavin reductase [Micromonospora sp. WMMD1120]
MPRRRHRDHRPTRPTWRCAACGIAWPCSAAKLRLLGEYRHDRVALAVYLATLLAEAGEHLTTVDPVRLAERFLAWTRARG